MSIIEEKQIQLQHNVSKIGSIINMSNIELITNDQPSSDPKIGGSLRFGDNRRRMLLEDNASPILPKIDNQNEINNPSNNSFFQPKQKQLKLNNDDSPRKKQQTFLALHNINSSPLSLNSPIKNSPDPDKLSQLQNQLNQEIGLSKFSGLNIVAASKPARLSLKISLMAKRFAQKFKLKASNILYSKLTDKQFNIIGDLSFSIRQHRENINSTFQIIWSIWNFIYMVILIIIIPVKFSLEISIVDFYEVLVYLTTLFMFMNIMIQMNQGIYKRGLLIKQRKQIIKNYIYKGKFWIDLGICLAFLISMSSEENHFFRLAIILKVGYVMDTYDSVQNMLEIKQKNKHYAIFLKVFFQILLIAHLAGCFFIKIGLNNRDIQNWISVQKIQYDDYQAIYTSAIYWSVITMITVGYGDITPVNSYEKTYVIFVSLISCGIFGYSLNVIGYILKEKEESKIQFQNKISDLSNFMKKRQVNRDMREKIFKYFHYLHKEEINENSKVQNMIQELPDAIRSNFVIELYSAMIRDQLFFKETFSDSFIFQICSLIKEIKIGPETNLNDVDKFNDGQSTPLHSRLYFLMKGKISYQTICQKQRVIKIYEKGDCFGMHNFIIGQANEVTPIYKTRSVVMLAYIEKVSFLQLLDTNPQEKERYFMAKDNIQFNNKNELSKQKCIACQNENHDVHQCERLHIKANREKIVYQINTSSNQERKPFDRSNKKSPSPYYYLNQYCESETNEVFDKAKKEYITQYTSHQMTNNHQQQQFTGQRHQSYQSNVSFQIRENSHQPLRLPNRKKTNQSVVIKEESIDNRKPILRIKEYKAQNSLGNSMHEQDLVSIQNRSKRSHSELQFQFIPEQIGSHQMIAYLSPRNGNSNQLNQLNQISSGSNNNTISLTNLAVTHPHQSNHNNTLSNFMNPNLDTSNNYQSTRELSMPKNDIYFNKEDMDDRVSLVLERKDEDQLSQSFNSLYRKRNVQKKQSKKFKGNGVFNMDDLKIKKQNGVTTLTAKQLSQTHIPEAQSINEDIQTSSINTFHQTNSNLQSMNNIGQQVNSKIAESQGIIVNNNNNNNNNDMMNDSNYHKELYDYDELEPYEDETQQKSQIQLFHSQLIQLKESKVFDLDGKREYKIYFPDQNYEIILQKLQKIAIVSPMHRNPIKGNRKQSKFRTTFNTPLAFAKRSDVSSLITKQVLKQYC